jgi:hypothetical protein
MKVNNDGLKERMKNMKKLKALMPDIVSGSTKKNAVKFCKSFQKWIKNNELSLEAVKDETSASKMRQGFKKPDSPLYGAGDKEQPNSYSSMMRVRSIKGGWKVFPSKKNHWSKDITLDYLFNIHEFGCKVKRGKAIIQIPERPALKNSQKKFFAVDQNKPEYIANRIKMLSKRFLNTGDKEIFQPFLEQIKMNRELHE